MSSWSDSKPPNVPARQPGDDVEAVALVDDLGDVRPAEGDAVEHVAVAAQGQLAVAAGRGPDAGHGQAEDGDERVGVARAARRQAGQLAVQGVVDVERRQGQVDRERRPAGRAAPRLGGEGQEPLAELVPAVGRQLEPGRAGMAADTG